MIGTIIKNYFRLAVLLGAASLASYGSTCGAAQADEIKLPEGTVSGRLSNGLEYLILKNDFPASRVEYRLVWRVGAVQQDDSQGGCAHFLEHMAFGGSKNFPDRGAVAYLESLGMKYGIDINAFTGHDRTIYMFATPSDIPDNNGHVKALQIIADWMDRLTINPDRVTTEKGIIQEELRGYSQDDPFYDLKIGQNRFSSRMPLGTPDEVNAVTADVLERFYRKWYLPRFAGLVVIGDVDPVVIEKEIKKQFSGIKAGKDPGLKHYTLDYNPSRQIMIDVDSLIGHEQIEIIIPHPTVVNRTIGDMRRSAMNRVVTDALSRRMATAGVPAEVSDSWYLANSNHLVFAVRDGKNADLKTNVAKTASVVSSVMQNGFSDDEIAYFAEKAAERAARQTHSGYSSAMLCDDFADYIISGDRYITDSAQVAELQDAIRSISAAEARDLLRGWISCSDTMLMALRTSEMVDEGRALDGFTAAWSDGMSSPAEPYEFELPQERPEVCVPAPAILSERHAFDPSMISARRDYASLGMRQLTLANGMTLLLKPTVDDGNVLFAMLSPGGYGTLSADKLPLYGSTASYIDMGGIAKAPDGLGDYMYANEIALGIALESNWHGYLGSFAADKSNEFFNLVYEKIVDPELRYNDFEDIRISMYDEPEESTLSKMLRRAPDRQLMARMDQLMCNTIDAGAVYDNADDRETLRRDYISRMNLDSIADFYRALYTQPEGNVFIVSGNFDPDSIAQTFASVFSRLTPTAPALQGHTPLALPDKIVSERFDSDDPSQTEFDYVYFGRFEPGLRNSLVLKLMSFILRNRVIADLREKRALVYSPYVVLNYEGRPRGYYYFDVSSSTDNRNMPAVKEALDGVLAELRETAVDDVELESIKRSCIINRRETLNPHSPSAWRSTLLSLLKNGESLDDFDRYESVIASITPEDIRRGFNEYINPDLYLQLYISAEEIK